MTRPASAGPDYFPRRKSLSSSRASLESAFSARMVRKNMGSAAAIFLSRYSSSSRCCVMIQRACSLSSGACLIHASHRPVQPSVGIAAGAVQGYFGGRLDLVMQRVIEIWSSLPTLYLLIILASIGMAQYKSGVVRAQEAVLKEDLFRMRDVLDQYFADKQQHPQSLEELVTAGYLRAIPKDPFTGSAETWQIVEAEPDPANPAGRGPTGTQPPPGDSSISGSGSPPRL